MDQVKECASEGPIENQDNKKSADSNGSAVNTVAGDWILELFAPHASVVDILADQNKPKEDEPRRIKIVSAFDPQSIKNIYERVHMMLKIDSEVKNEQTGGAGRQSFIHYFCAFSSSNTLGEMGSYVVT
jgi:hypothetical protein